jgi:hypothetical protein
LRDEGCDQDFYSARSSPPQKRSLVTTTTFIDRKSLHTRTSTAEKF